MEGNKNGSKINFTLQHLKIAAVVLFYFVISISMVFINKALMREYKFEFPIFMTFFQQIVSLICLIVAGFLGRIFSALSFIPIIEFDSNIAFEILPLTGILVGMLSFNNLCLNYVEVWFYMIARALTIFFTILLSYFVMKVKTSPGAIKACALVFAGFLMGSLGQGGAEEKNVDTEDSLAGPVSGSLWSIFTNTKSLGILFGVFSSFFVSLYSIFVKKKLLVVNRNEWRLLSYNTILSIILLMPVVVISGELHVIQSVSVIHQNGFWMVMFIAGVFSFLISLAMFMQIKVTSPLTNTISGTLKACVQTILSVIIWGTRVTFATTAGNILVIFGSFYYSLVRFFEMEKNRAQPLKSSKQLHPNPNILSIHIENSDK